VSFAPPVSTRLACIKNDVRTRHVARSLILNVAPGCSGLQGPLTRRRSGILEIDTASINSLRYRAIPSHRFGLSNAGQRQERFREERFREEQKLDGRCECNRPGFLSAVIAATQ
jgi:hypothetical protein